MLVNFSGSSLRRAVFCDTIAFGAIFVEADLADADLSRARGFTAEQLGLAYGNAGTRLPPELAGLVLREKTAAAGG